METSQKLTKCRDNLISHIENLIIPAGFAKKTSGEYILIRTVQQPGSQYIINGQVYQQPGTPFDIQLGCELVGPGAIISEDGSENPFELIRFSMNTGDHSREISVNVYYDTPTEFDDYIKQLFGI